MDRYSNWHLRWPRKRIGFFVAFYLLASVVLLFSGCGSGSFIGTISNNPPPNNPPPTNNPPPQISSGVVLMTYTGPGGTVYDATHKYLFVTLTKFDRVDVFSTLDYHLVASIPVPAPMGIDISTDDSQVVVGSSIPSFFTIDTKLLQVTGSVSVPLQGTGNVQVVAPTGLARSGTGNLLLLVNVLNTSDSEQLAEWNPASGQFTYRQDFTSPPSCIAASADHSKILVGACGIRFSPYPGQEVGLYDSASDTFTNFLYGFGYLGGMASNANGTQFAASVNDNSLILLDSNFNIQTTIQGGALGLQFLVGDLVFSRDGRYLYVFESDPGAGAFVTVLDTTTFAVVGSQVVANGGSSYALPQFLQPPSIDENNILFVPLGGSIGVTPTAQTPFSVNPGLRSVVPPQGFSQTSTELSISGDSPQLGFTIQNAGPTSGGTKSQLFVYGTAPNVTIGGVPATITDAEPGDNFSSNMPGWMEGITVQLPQGKAGLNNVGMGALTMSRAFNYVDEQVVPVSGTPWQLVYDQGRQQLYISNARANRVEVYSLTSHRLLTPLPAGNSPHGLALTPDGSLLVIANSGDGTVTIVNPDNPTGATTLVLGTVGGSQPNEVVITNTGKALVTYSPDFAEIDLSTHAINFLSNNRIYTPDLLMGSKDGSKIVCDCGSLGILDSSTGNWTFTTYFDEQVFGGAISGDGNIVAQGDYILNPQLVITNQLAKWDFLPGAHSLSGNSDILNASGSLAYKTDKGSDAIHATGIQIFDVNHGDLKEWVELPEPVANNSQHQLTLDDAGNNLYVLTQSGFTSLHFAFVPLSVAYMNPGQGPASGGTSLTIRGSGFEPASQVYLNGAPAATTVLDSQTITAVTPQMTAGPVQLKIQNPDGQAYSLDNLFAVR
jgi:DNA-binding beta-propeller fold protein YncE